MKIKNNYNLTWFSIVVSVLLFSFTDLYSQETQHKPSRQAAMEAFSDGDYEKAFREFQILLQVYSKDPLYKYYSGVCLVKRNIDPETSSDFLREALNGSLDIKSIPDDAWFYLGRSQQMAGRFPDAIDSFNNFEEKAGKKERKGFKCSRIYSGMQGAKGRTRTKNHGRKEHRRKDYCSACSQTSTAEAGCSGCV